MVSGILPGPPAFLHLLDDLDLRVAADDLLNCGRRLPVPPVEADEPFEALTERYFRMPACPTRSAGPRQRAQRLLSLVESTRAAGVVFTVQPFCDPELFDLPHLVAEVKKAGIATLALEVGINRRLSGQAAVRVEAFAEMIGPAARETRRFQGNRMPSRKAPSMQRPLEKFQRKRLQESRYRFMKDLAAPVLSVLGRRRAGKRRRGSRSHLGPPLQCNDRLKALLTRHYLLARYAKGARPVAWVTSGAPVELLRVFDFYTVYPENHGALCGARRMGTGLCRAAEARGYSRELCAYARIDLGHHYTGKTPVGSLPRPDVMMACNNICQTVVYWYQNLARCWNIPLLLVDTPYNFAAASDSSIEYIAAQLEEMIPVLEGVSNRRFEPARLRRIMHRSKASCALWGRILDTMKARPAPMTIFDAFAHLAPIVSLRGLEVARTYYRTLLAELQQRVALGIGGLATEHKRLMWDNIAIWFKARELASLFARRGLNFVTATYTTAWADTAAMIDPQRPLESMAAAYSRVILNNNLPHRLERMKRLIREFEVQGLVMHSARSCKPYSIGQYDLKRFLSTAFQIPSVMIEADIADERVYSEKQVSTQLALFFESLDDGSAPTS